MITPAVEWLEQGWPRRDPRLGIYGSNRPIWVQPMYSFKDDGCPFDNHDEPCRCELYDYRQDWRLPMSEKELKSYTLGHSYPDPHQAAPYEGPATHDLPTARRTTLTRADLFIRGVIDADDEPIVVADTVTIPFYVDGDRSVHLCECSDPEECPYTW